MAEERKNERKKESIWNGRKDEIIALYLSYHLLFSAPQTWNEKKEGRKDREQHTKRNTTTKILSMSREYCIGFGSDCFCYLRHSGVSMSVLFPSA